MVMAAAAPAPAPILWDVIDEHLDEGEFSFTRWRRALEAPHFILSEVKRKREEPLLAHIDGLVVGGAAVAEARLQPELEAEEPGAHERIVVAALALLAGGREAAVWKALSAPASVVRQAAAEALVLATPAA